MGAETEFSILVLALSLAHLATDVTLWALEPPPSPGLSEPTPDRRLPGEQEPKRPGSATAALATMPADHRAPVTRNDREPFGRLPLDFSIDQPPWCVPCQRPSPRLHIERRQTVGDLGGAIKVMS